MDLFVDFLRKQWREQGRLSTQDNERSQAKASERWAASSSAQDVQLTLYSSNGMFESFNYISRALQFIHEMEHLRNNRYSGEERHEKILDLYVNVVRPERITRKKRRTSGGSSSGRLLCRERASDIPSGATDYLQHLSPLDLGPSSEISMTALADGPHFPPASLDGPRARPGSPPVSVDASVDASACGSGSVTGSNDVTLDSLKTHRDMLLHLLVFDAWTDLLRSSVGAMLEAELIASSKHDNAVLGDTVASCRASLPVDTDGWLRLFMASVHTLQIGVLACDMTLPGAPICFVNEGFTNMTGYSAAEAVGNNCGFLQSPKSDPETVKCIRLAMQTSTDVHVQILNMRKDGALFLNMLSLRPLCDSEVIDGQSFRMPLRRMCLAVGRTRC